MAANLRPMGLPSRSALVAVLLILTLGLAGVLAYQAVDATRSHREMAEKTLKEHALFAAWELSSSIRMELYSQLLGPGLEVVAKSGGMFPELSMDLMGPIKKTGMELGWKAAEGDLDYVFRYRIGSGEFESTGEVEPTPAARDWLMGLLESRVAESGGGEKKYPWTMSFHGLGDDRRIIAIAVDPIPGTEEFIGFGFQSTMAPFMKIMERIEKHVPLLPPALFNEKPEEDFLAFAVVHGMGEPLFVSSREFKSPYVGMDTVGASFGGLRAVVILRPDVAEELVIGGLPRSRLPVILGLMALASGMVVAAMFQIRREQELSLLRTDFVSSVSHQLRTPLAQIRMFGETLLLGRVRTEEERQRSLEIIVKESQSLTHQVDNVLLFSRAQKNDVRLNPVETTLVPLIHEVLESFRPLAEAQNCKVEASLESGLAALADPGALKQILLNLLENAVKYGPRDQIIDVKLRRGTTGTIRLEVEDEGEGIPSDERKSVFTPYARLDRDRDSGVAGSGIGLAVVRELVNRQGGTVWVEESMGGGARLVVELPESVSLADGRHVSRDSRSSETHSAPVPASPAD